MGLDNPIHILFLLVLALLVFGAKRLPEMGKSLGEGMRGFKDSLNPQPQAAQINPMSITATVPATEPSAAQVPVVEPVALAAETVHQA
jgi:sec-independent protein translocase protein TatA